MHLRRAEPDDLPALARLYEAAVRVQGPAVFDAEQVDVWAATARDEERFRAFVLEAWTLVAEEDAEVVGFGGLREDGCVASLYVHPEQAWRGIGSLLLEALLARAEEVGLRRLTVAASPFSRPLLERYGFRVLHEEVVERHGVRIPRWRMERG